ncbi:MAG: hypothetical protein IJI88_01265, partial [Atopobiaceae bacterium]|nr:hypothetical protein [Atopobiaceae bacterium]
MRFVRSIPETRLIAGVEERLVYGPAKQDALEVLGGEVGEEGGATSGDVLLPIAEGDGTAPVIAPEGGRLCILVTKRVRRLPWVLPRSA